MANHDYIIANDTAANVRGDLNNALAAIKSSNSGTSAPASPVEGMTWYDTSNDKLFVYRNSAWALVPFIPSGTINMYGGGSDPDGWLICDGRSFSTTGTYAALFAVIGYNYGGSGSSFNIPNALGRAPIGAGHGSGLSSRSRGQTGGTESERLTRFQIPPHNHTINHQYVPDRDDDENKNTIIQGGSTTTSNGNVGENGNGTGQAAAHNNMMPFWVVNFIIKI